MINERNNEDFNDELNELIESETEEKNKTNNKFLFFGKKSDRINPLDKTENKKRRKYIGAIAAFAIILSVGVVGNWYYENSDISSTVQPILDSAAEKTLGKAELVDATTQSVEENSYFSTARVERRTARDQSMEKLQSIINSSEESEQAKKEATDRITAISSYINMENKIETLVCSKGVNNCLAIINEDGSRVDVIVDCDELDDTIIMQIKDIAVSQSGCSFENVSIIQSKDKNNEDSGSVDN